jgi:hypothetical protein
MEFNSKIMGDFDSQETISLIVSKPLSISSKSIVLDQSDQDQDSGIENQAIFFYPAELKEESNSNAERNG